MNLADLDATGRLDPAVRRTIEAHLRDLGESDLAAILQQSPPEPTLRLKDRVILAVDSGLLVFVYSLPEGGGCKVAAILTPWREVRVSELSIETDWKPSMTSIPRTWTLKFSTPDLTLHPHQGDIGDLIAFARLSLERTSRS